MTAPLEMSGTVIGSFRDYDGLVEGLRARAASINLSYRIVEELAGMGEGALGKYLASIRQKQLTIASLLRITEVMGVRVTFVIDDDLLDEMRPLWEARDAKKAHARRRASLGRATMDRLLPVVFSEFAKLGAAARNEKLTPRQRSRSARRAARARWNKSR